MQSLFDTEIKTGAIFSPCRTWRYALWRTWDEDAGHMAVVGLNPSKATEIDNDNTVTRCINFANGFGYGGLFMLNLFGYRSTDRKVLKHVGDPIGMENDHYLLEYHAKAAVTVLAWGTDGVLGGRNLKVLELLQGDLHCLRVTKGGHPEHPLYLPNNTTLKLFRPGAT